MGCRCYWDSDTDNYAQDIFMNVRFPVDVTVSDFSSLQDTLFCVAAAYGIYYY